MLEGREECGENDDELGSEEEKEVEEKEDEDSSARDRGEVALKKTCEPWSGRERREEGGVVDVD